MLSFLKMIKTKKEKVSKYEVKKSESLTNYKLHFPANEFTYEYINGDLTNFLFIDEINQEVGIYNKADKNLIYSEERIYKVKFSEIMEIGIAYPGGEILIESVAFDPLFITIENIYDLESLLADLKGNKFKIFIADRGDGLLNTGNRVNVDFYNIDDENLETVKVFFRLLYNAFVSGEKVYRKLNPL